MLGPGFFHNEILIEMHPLTRLLFAGLWTIADREGRLEDRPKRIKLALLPADEYDIDSALTELHHAGFIIRYATRDGNYIQINKFLKHQKPPVREAASEIPPPGTDKAVPSTDLGMPKANLGDDEHPPRWPVSVSVSTSVPVSNSVARGPKQAGRIYLHRWQLDKLIDTLGPHAADFALDDWLEALNGSIADKALPRDPWKFVEDALHRELQRRGLTVAESTPAAPTNKRIAGLVAGGEAFLKRAAEGRRS